MDNYTDDTLPLDAKPTFASLNLPEDFFSEKTEEAKPVIMTEEEFEKGCEEMFKLHAKERTMMLIRVDEYEELKEKAGKWDVSQLMTIQMLYGEKPFDLSNAKWDEPTEKELVATVMKAMTGAIKNGAIKIKRKENEE